ncbi:MAG: SHOCT domain-containing protein [Planctomycetota bacterium]
MVYRPARLSLMSLLRSAAAVGVSLGWAGRSLAQAPGGNPFAENSGQVLFWCAVLLGAAIALGLAFFIIRKRLNRMDEEASTVNPMGFTLADLREMHAQGQISDEEFEFAKRKMIAKAKAKLDADNASDGEEPEITDLGDLTEATSADKAETPAPPSDEPPADKNEDSDEEPPPPDEPPTPPKPPKHW